MQTLHAEALMDRNPWKLWSPEGAPAPGTEQIVATLESVIARDPNHLGANHYYIHAVEASPRPEKAEASADRLGALAPKAGHIVHMPAHIYQRVGRYADASESNRKAAAADLAYQQQAKPRGHVYPMYTSHNFGFLAYSASMEGRKQETLEAARASAKHFPPELLAVMPGMDFFTAQPLFAMVRFGDWERLLAEPRPDAKYPVQTGLWLHAHGMALAATGQLEQARADLAELKRLARTVPPTMAANLNTARDVLGVAVRVLEARVAQAEGRPQALALWEEAVNAADRLSYAEPADWFYPVRHYQGAALLDAGRFQEAEAVYREDLKRNPKNGWALFGLAQSLEGQGRQEDAARTRAAFETAWARSDFPLTTTAP
ncbi:tetratricopeptide repeat protein [Corallococcus macrosporus]|uniref:TPR repeat-containing protein n=1 Tax=Myxococcus fulvus (strain ATCC BAA-855 / HW-1) TaxID=483219 RepID=F8C7V0_MYXFH|nr:tetratricopeptide repeat protein [Corallococcus macrosporus]AEI65701.1 TPR repeat-containing protein [Corallococcus macrosporus]